MPNAQTWRESFGAEPVHWLAEYVYRSVLRLPIQFLRKGLGLWWWLDRRYPASGRAFPARVGRIVLSVTLYDEVGRAIFYGRGSLRYERETSRVLLEELKPNDVFLDGGASYGWYTALAFGRIGRDGSICSVEANRARARVLLDALRRSGATDTSVIGAALGSSPGRATLGSPFLGAHEYHRTVGGRSDGHGDSVEVDVFTVDSLNLARLDVMKLDIEGAEVDALMGAAETLRRCRPRLLLVEAIDENLARCGQSLENLASFLDANGYNHSFVTNSPYEAPMWACRPAVS